MKLKQKALSQISTSRSAASGAKPALHTGTIAINLSTVKKPPTRLRVKSLPKKTSSMFQQSPLKYEIGNRLIRTTEVSLDPTFSIKIRKLSKKSNENYTASLLKILEN